MTFLQTAMLAGLGMVAVPLLLHLLTRRKVREVVFPAVMFLLGSKKRSLKLLTLKQWLVMLLRMAAIACLVMAVAMPVMESLDMKLPGGETPGAMYIIVDDTMSMEWSRGGVTLRERAASAVGKIVSGAGANDEIYMRGLCGGGIALTASGNHRNASKQAYEMKSEWCGADMMSAIEEGVDYLGKTPFPDRRLIVISDFQENLFPALRTVEGRGGVKITLIDLVAAGTRMNTFVSALEMPLFPMKGENIPICYKLDVDGASGGDVKVSLIVDGLKRGEHAAESGEAAQSEKCFNVTVGETGLHTGVVSVFGDDFTPDNDKNFVFEVSGGIKAVVVSGKESERDARSDAFYLVRALQSASGAGPGEKPVNVLMVDPKNLNGDALVGVNIVFVSAGAALDKNMLSLLGEYVSSGGGVFVLSGTEPGAGEMVAKTLLGNGVKVFTRGKTGDETANAGGSVTPEIVDMNHPMFRGVAGERVASDLRQTVFSGNTYMGNPGPEVKPVISFGGSRILMVERDIGRGKVVAMAGGLGPELTNFPLRPSFVPFILQIARYLSAEHSQGDMAFDMGKNISIRLDGIQTEEEYDAVSMDGISVHMRKVRKASSVELSPVGVLPPGMYKIVSRNGAEAGRIVINNPVSESLLAGISQNDREKVFGDKKNILWVNADRRFEAEDFIRMVDRGRLTGMWSLFAIVAAGLLIAETVLANRR